MGKVLVIFCASHRVIFSLRESDIETYGFSDIIFAFKTREANITLLEISRLCEVLQRNITAKQYNSPKANITEKTFLFSQKGFFSQEAAKKDATVKF